MILKKQIMSNYQVVILLLFLVGDALGSSAKDPWEVKNLTTPKYKGNQYELLILNNGMKVLLISNKNIPQSSLYFDVAVGSLSDKNPG